MKPEQCDVFLLTKNPFNPRSNLCLKLAARSGNSMIYLSGDGVYHLLSRIEELPGCKVYACKEDMEARAIKPRENVTVLENFYTDLVEIIMEHCRHVYSF
jgi:tRNA 2-thiouridine synthesizing protein B